MRAYVAWLGVLLCGFSAVEATEDAGLVLHYTFDEGAGGVVRDKSGHGNDGRIVGRAKWAQQGDPAALAFNGTDTYIECGSKPSLQLAKAGTLEVWCFPEAIQGGLISWHTGPSWGDQRILLTFFDYGLVYKDLVFALADGAWGTSFQEAHNPGEWAHIAMTFDGSHICLYRNGQLLQRVGQDIEPVTKGVPMRVGLTDGSGSRCFKGRMAEVRVYNRALSRKQIAAHFRARAGAMGIGSAGSARIVTRLDAKGEKLAVEADLEAVGAARIGHVVKIALWNADNKTWVADRQAEITKDSRKVGVTFPTGNLVPGTHELRLSLEDPLGNPVGIEAAATCHFPSRAKVSAMGAGAKILNNMVVELINKKDLPAEPHQELTFTNPRDGWVFISTTAKVDGKAAVTVAVDAEESRPVLVHRAGDPATMETMRYLPVGKRVLRIWCGAPDGQARPVIESLIVRSIPEMMQCNYPASSLAGYGHYTLKFLAKDVLPNVTTFVGGVHLAPKAEQEMWKKLGRSWLLEHNIPSLVNRSVPVTPEVAYNWWVDSYGFQSALAGGVMADEFSEGDHPSYHGYIEAVKRIGADPAFADKRLYAWVASRTIHTVEALSKRFVETVIAGNSNFKIAHEAYLSEKKTRRQARDIFDNKIGRQMRLWQEAFPGVMERIIFVAGYMAAPPESLDVDPQVDYKVFLDMQFHYLATRPECFGLYGVMVYKARYADEETVRWAGRLFRHYCIEGNTDPLSDRYGYKYRLEHVQNADFDKGPEGWTIAEAQPGSVTTGKIIGVGRMQGRVAAGMGNHFLLTKRCENKPNRVSQPVKGLTPGKLYSMKIIIADHQDWLAGKSERKTLAVSIDLDRAEILKDKSFMMPNHSFLRLGPFAKEGGGVPWHNFHWLVFRATEATAGLTLSDWADDKAPGGPIGRELMYNFVEVQPYFE